MSGLPSLAPSPDAGPLYRFDQADEREYRMRSALEFSTSFKCPARLYRGSEEPALDEPNGTIARQAKAAGLDVEAITVEGDHSTMVARAIPLAIAFFQQQR
jgi:hypothetical protein